jgi:hypothetical protein
MNSTALQTAAAAVSRLKQEAGQLYTEDLNLIIPEAD